MGLTLGLGTGVSAVLFGIVERVFVRAPAHVAQPEELYRLHVLEADPTGQPVRRPRLSYVEFTALAVPEPRSYDAAAYAPPIDLSVVSTARGWIERTARVAGVSDGFFELLGTRAVSGRLGSEPEEGVVVREAFWEAIVGTSAFSPGRTVTIRNRSYEIAGVVPNDFTGVGIDAPDIWMPIAARDGRERAANPGWFDLKVVIRLRGATPDRAIADAARALGSRGKATIALVTVEAARAADLGAGARLVVLLSAVAAAMLILGGISAANMLLARSVARLRELGVRMALGMDRRALTRLLAADCVVVMTVGGLTAVAVAWFFGNIARGLLLPASAVRIGLADVRVIGFVVIAMIVVGAFITAALAIKMGELTPVTGITERGAGKRLPASATLRLLTVAQTTLAFAMLAATALFFRSLRNAQSVDVGIDPQGIVYVRLLFDSSGYARPMGLALAHQIRDRASERPWVQSAALASGLPLTSYGMLPIRVPGAVIPNTAGGGPNVNVVAPDYFATVGSAILRGRSFGSGDREGAELVAIVNETMARLVWAGADPLGRCILVGPVPFQCFRVVGIAEDAHTFGLREEQAMQYYLPAAQRPALLANPYLIVRARPGAEGSAGELQRVVSMVAPSLRTEAIRRLEDTMARLTRQWQVGTTMLVTFGVVALVVAFAGVFGVVALSVARRERECCIRLALGASRLSVLLLLLRSAAVNVVVAIGFGVLVIWAVSRPLAPVLFDVSPFDLVSHLAAIMTVVVSSLAAAALPSWRAARISPARVTE